MLVEKFSDKNNTIGILNEISNGKLFHSNCEYSDENLQPSPETLEAMNEVKNGKVSKPYSDIEELMKDLLK